MLSDNPRVQFDITVYMKAIFVCSVFSQQFSLFLKFTRLVTYFGIVNFSRNLLTDVKIYLVFSKFTITPTSLFAVNKYDVFLFMVHVFPSNKLISLPRKR